MAAQSIARRPKRPQQAEPDDLILARVLEAAEWTRRNAILVGATVATLVVVIAGLFWYRWNVERQREDAAIAFLQVEQAVLSGDQGIAAQQLQDFLQQHSDTPYGDEARVLLGQVHLRAGRNTEAIAALQPVADRMDDSVVGAQAGLLLASAQVAAGQQEEAIETYLEVGEEADTQFRRREGLTGAALLMQEGQDYAGAVEIFQQLVDMTEEGSADRLIYEMRLAEAQALAAAQ
jgi:predicted negative regulator of RcsB-dependent stress response